ncbi:MAG: bifunctional diguanylate cyclase/phosphodiesterase [Nocardiaceae bacterium]|nr:bifunctional diguanylate cyclase/phosphodiesterase [Nocardiaceae bacterium]
MQTTTGAFYFGGGSVGLVVALLMADGPGSRAAVVALATFAMTAGIIMVRWGSRMPRLVGRVMLGLGPFVIATAIVVATDSFAAIALSVLFVLVATDAALFCPPVEASLYIAVSIVCSLLSVAWRADLAWWVGVASASTTLLIGISTLVLAGWAGNAEVDGLTGLLNRRGFDRALRNAISAADPDGIPPAVVFFDIDHFKRLNDINGHSYGDEVLVHVARTWSSLIPPNAKLGRYGGDEFALLLVGMREAAVVSCAEELRDSVNVRCSAGATSWNPGESSSLMTGRADVALYRAKNSGRNRITLESGNRTPIAAEFQATMSSGMKLAYQPIVRLDQPNNPIVAVEALIRWESVLKPGLTPMELIEIAEASGLIVDLDCLVLRRACEEAHELQAAFGTEPLQLHVNVSGLTLIDPRYLDTVSRVLMETGWPATQLIIEVTETVVDADNSAALNCLDKLRAGGIRIAIDDFGTGYSSLSRLQSLPADQIKLDGAFVAASSTHGASLLGAVAVLGHGLHMPTIAERVETAEEARLLTELGYPMAQGFFFGKPVSCDELVRRFREDLSSAAARSVPRPAVFRRQ